MKIIGEKLTNNELLMIKGGSFASFDCKCTSGPKNGDTWTADYDTALAILAGIESKCGESSNGECNAS